MNLQYFWVVCQYITLSHTKPKEGRFQRRRLRYVKLQDGLAESKGGVVRCFPNLGVAFRSRYNLQYSAWGLYEGPPVYGNCHMGVVGNSKHASNGSSSLAQVL